MKKLFLTFLMLTLILGTVAVAQNNCSSPIVITIPPTSWPYQDLNQTTCGRGDDYTEGATCLWEYGTGEDIIYQINVTENSVVDITLDPKGSDMVGLAISAETCPPPSDGCLYTAFIDGGNPGSITGVEFNAGVTYYMIIDCNAIFGIESCIPDFDLTISEYSIPTGRCCFGNLSSPSCADDELQADCEARGDYISWAEGLNCTDDPCPAPAAGDDCSNPIVITIPPTSWPYQDLNQTTCGRGDDYFRDICLWEYGSGEDIIYQLNVTENSVVDITLDPKGSDVVGLAISAETCPPPSDGCLYTAYIDGGDPGLLTGVELNAGVTYYMMIDCNAIFGGESCIPDFDLTISEGSIPTGRCCFGNQSSPSCADDELQADCEARGDYISWAEGLNCTDDPCPAPAAGDDCSNPIVITIPPTSWPYQDLNQTTCGRGDDYTEGATCLWEYGTGEDIIYQINVTENSIVDITLDPKGSDVVGLAISAETCPPPSDGCLYTAFIDGGNPGSITGVEFNAGVTYYMIIDCNAIFGIESCIPDFDLTISEYSIPTGRCCFGNLSSPSCADDELQADCEARGDYISWAEGLNCTDDPCPASEPGDDCSNPIVITIPPTSWPYQDLNQTTCGRGYDHIGDYCLFEYGSGEDIIYQLNVTENSVVDIVLDPKGTGNVGLAISSNTCPPQASDCLHTMELYSGDEDTLIDVELEAGVTYYLIISSNDMEGTSCISDFDISISTETNSYEYLPGDANMSTGIWPPSTIGGDVTYLVNYFRGITAPCMLDGFYASADANGSCSITGADVTKLVSYFRGIDDLSYCVDYPTTWPPIPDTAPDGWPNCASPVLSK